MAVVEGGSSSRGGGGEERNLPPLPVVEDHFCRCGQIWLSSLPHPVPAEIGDETGAEYESIIAIIAMLVKIFHRVLRHQRRNCFLSAVVIIFAALQPPLTLSSLPESFANCVKKCTESSLRTAPSKRIPRLAPPLLHTTRGSQEPQKPKNPKTQKPKPEALRSFLVEWHVIR